MYDGVLWIFFFFDVFYGVVVCREEIILDIKVII